MTTQQPEALRLAEVAPYLDNGERGQWIMSAAAELRRLHESNQELLAALKEAHACILGDHWGNALDVLGEAIKKAERTTT